MQPSGSRQPQEESGAKEEGKARVVAEGDEVVMAAGSDSVRQCYLSRSSIQVGVVMVVWATERRRTGR